jgi:FkbM family methyltransferase
VPFLFEGLVMVQRNVVSIQKEEIHSAQEINEVYGTAYSASRWRMQGVTHQREVAPSQNFEDTRKVWVQAWPTYSQSGEDYDFYLNFMANRNTTRYPGHFVEIGALNGITFSNTKFLEDSFGWSGLLIEATPKSVEELRKNRPSEKNLIIGEGVCPKDQGLMDFVVGDFGAVNGDPNTMTDKFKEKWHDDSKVAKLITVPCRPLGQMLREYLQHSGADSIDFFSLDVEGGELKVLETMDWSVPVKVWCIEFDGTDPSKEQSIRELMSKNGYVVGEFTHSERNEWFVKSDFEKELRNQP